MVAKVDNDLLVPTLNGRVDLHLISQLVAPRSTVLDLGCGDGELMELLITERQVTARGVEISEEGVYRCIARGLSVHHGDLDEGLGDYPDSSFDYVVLSQTLQAVHRPRLVVQEMLRVGRLGIVTFPNFAHWRVRADLALRGQMPKTADLPYEWYDTPNIHLTTIKDFLALCRVEGITVVNAIYLSGGRRVRCLPNLLAQMALFVVEKGTGKGSREKGKGRGESGMEPGSYSLLPVPFSLPGYFCNHRGKVERIWCALSRVAGSRIGSGWVGRRERVRLSGRLQGQEARPLSRMTGNPGVCFRGRS